MLKPITGSSNKQPQQVDQSVDESSISCKLNKHLVQSDYKNHSMMQLPAEHTDFHPYCGHYASYYSSQQTKLFMHTNLNKLHNFIRMAKSCLRYNQCNNRHNNGYNEPLINHSRYSLAVGILICILGTLVLQDNPCLAVAVASKDSSQEPITSASKDQTQEVSNDKSSPQPQIQSRSGAIDPADYVDDGAEFEAMANQQQIPTAQLMSAAGHVVPENFFLPGGIIPTNHYATMQRVNVPAYPAQHPPNAAMTPTQDMIHSIQARQVNGKYGPRQVAPQNSMDLLTSASSENETPLIDFNGYNLATQPDGREVGTPQVDLVDFLNERDSNGAKYQQQQQHQMQEQHASDIYDRSQEQSQQVQMPLQNQLLRPNEHQMMAPGEPMAMGSEQQYSQSMGPDYQIVGQTQQQPEYEMSFNGQVEHQKDQSSKKPYGLPNKSSNNEPTGMLKPLGNPQTISSPLIDLAANTLPKTPLTEKLNDKLPHPQTPTVFSFSSSKDPMEKGKVTLQKKRNIMKQAEQMARMAVKAFNDKFGTNLGDATDIPFLLSTLGPIGFAQNLLFDPTLFITLLNSAERALMSDVLPAPAKTGFRVVLNAFRMPNKKRDKANLLNIISYLASGGQTPSSVPSKHRQGSGIEKKSKNKR